MKKESFKRQLKEGITCPVGDQICTGRKEDANGNCINYFYCLPQNMACFSDEC